MKVLLIILNILFGFILCFASLIYCNPKTFIKSLIIIFMIRHRIGNEGDINATHAIKTKMPEELKTEQETQKEETNE